MHRGIPCVILLLYVGENVVDEYGKQNGTNGAALPKPALQLNGLGNAVSYLHPHRGIAVQLLDKVVGPPLYAVLA